MLLSRIAIYSFTLTLFIMKKFPVLFFLLTILVSCSNDVTEKQQEYAGTISSNDVVASTTNMTSTLLGTVQGVPYFYQYSNAINPAGSCQNTSMAMVLRYYAMQEGKSDAVISQITPDYISSRYGTSQAQTVAGFQTVFNELASSLGLAVRDTGTEIMPLATYVSVSGNGKPNVVHGYFTAYGHVMVVLGYDGVNYICNDPAGKWSQKYKSGGYSGQNSTEGIGIKYAKAAFERAISPDKKVWVHIFN
jgi:uncharacterized protein YvpB